MTSRYHRTVITIDYDTKHAAASCVTCGWTGRSRPTRQDANTDAETHELATAAVDQRRPSTVDGGR